MKTNTVLLFAMSCFLLLGGLERAWGVVDPARGKKKLPEVRGAADPGTLQAYRNRIGDVLYFEVTGGVGGTIWGTDVYTDDSLLATAAVHAGVLRTGQKGVVKVTMLPGQANYLGSTRNGVTSQPYQNWQASYRVEQVGPRVRVRFASRERMPADGVRPDPGTLDGLRGNAGKSFLFEVTGNTQGTIWGTGVYTDDSSLSTAVVHAGILRNGQKGIVKVTILAGQAAYQKSTANGVTSGDWGNWTGSYKVEAVKPAKKRKR
jgi:hypothetical protein